jgi:fructose-specific component phosphotransferase system IIB-like protein
MAEISATKAKLTSAETAGDRDLIIVYGNILNQQYLLAAGGNLV